MTATAALTTELHLRALLELVRRLHWEIVERLAELRLRDGRY